MIPARPAILVIVRDEAFRLSIRNVLEAHGYPAILTVDVPSGLAAAKRQPPGLIIIDRNQDGSVLKKDRHLAALPILAVQPQGCTDDECSDDLERGFDAYLCKASVSLLIARVRALLRRELLQSLPVGHFSLGKLVLDVDRHEITVDGRLVNLTAKEFLLLHEFMRDPSKVFTRNQLLDRIWGEGTGIDPHTVDVHIHSLRRKLRPHPNAPHVIITIRGVGYRMGTMSS